MKTSDIAPDRIDPVVIVRDDGFHHSVAGGDADGLSLGLLLGDFDGLADGDSL
jgi:hypothetical protein